MKKQYSLPYFFRYIKTKVRSGCDRLTPPQRLWVIGGLSGAYMLCVSIMIAGWFMPEEKEAFPLPSAHRYEERKTVDSLLNKTKHSVEFYKQNNGQ